jgi:formylglycine-generating enzyme required for sulfatase activity
MAIAVTCNACHTELLVRDEFLNKEVQCPVCQATLAAAGDHVSDHEVFISYSNKDQTAANAVCATLEAQGIRCWIAPRDIPPGAAWGGSIIKAIEDARIMVLIYSGSANLSPQVIREVERAVSKGLVLVPLRIEDARMSKEMEYFLSRSHWLDALTPPLENHMAKLAETCRLLLLQDPQEMPLGPVSVWTARHPITKLKVPERSAPTPQPTAERSNTGTLVAAISLVALAVGLAVWQPWKSPAVPTVPNAPPAAPAVAGRAPSRGETLTPTPPAVASGPTTTVVVAATTVTTAVVQPATNTGPSQPSPPPQVTATTTNTGANLPKEMTIELGGDVKMELVLIRPGTFTMGSRECSNATPHKVTITKPFYLGKFEVTQEQWQAVMRSNPSQSKGAKKPVEMVSWDNCQLFLRELQAKVPGQRFRLPTEAEWEYACCAGSTTRYCYGDDDVRLGLHAWYKSNSDSTTHPVGEKKSNAWGLYDMLGNVREWCQDWCGDYPNGEVASPTGPTGGTVRVSRGGSWNVGPDNCRSAVRFRNTPDFRHNYIGFRLCLDFP